jgi:cell division transport system permease protein
MCSRGAIAPRERKADASYPLRPKRVTAPRRGKPDKDNCMPASLDSLEFVFEEVIADLRRDRVISLATVGIVMVAMLLLGAISLFVFNLRMWTDRISSELTLTLYLQKDVSRSRAIALRSEISGWPKVTSARLSPREEVWKNFRATHPVGERLDSLDNPLTDEITVQTEQTEDRRETAGNLVTTARRLADLKEAKDVVPAPDTISARGGLPQKILSLKFWVNAIALVLSIAMGLAAFLVIHNTSRLSLYARRREIYVMQLVGATPTFIAAPFLLEGAVLGFLGATLACCILVPLHMYLRALAAVSGWTLLQLLPDSSMLPFALTIVLGAVLFGIAGAGISLARFLSRPVEMEGH